VEGQNVVLEYRGAEGKRDRLPDLAAELVRLKVDVIMTGGGQATQAAMSATRTIPIVTGAAAARASGLVASLARPGGNVTGLSVVNVELSAKKVELLKEVLPRVSRVAILGNPTNPIYELIRKETQRAAQIVADRASGRGTSGSERARDGLCRYDKRECRCLHHGAGRGTLCLSAPSPGPRGKKRAARTVRPSRVSWTPAASWRTGRGSRTCSGGPPPMW
jgi:ABC transporter substrate binding protein